jgi:hypothetical protein
MIYYATFRAGKITRISSIENKSEEEVTEMAMKRNQEHDEYKYVVITDPFCKLMAEFKVDERKECTDRIERFIDELNDISSTASELECTADNAIDYFKELLEKSERVKV